MQGVSAEDRVLFITQASHSQFCQGVTHRYSCVVALLICSVLCCYLLGIGSHVHLNTDESPPNDLAESTVLGCMLMCVILWV